MLTLNLLQAYVPVSTSTGVAASMYFFNIKKLFKKIFSSFFAVLFHTKNSFYLRFVSAVGFFSSTHTHTTITQI